MSTGKPQSGNWMRTAVFTIGGLEAVAMLFFVWHGAKGLNSGEQLSRSISKAVVIVYSVPLLVLVVPALVLAAMNRWTPFALGLCTLGVGAAFVVMNFVLR